MSRLERDGSLTVLASSYQGKRLNSPNDLVYRSDGSVYFTDPPFGLPKFAADPRKELPFSGVFRVTPAGKISLLTQEFTGPNGIAFSPDEKTLYVGNWDPRAKLVKKYPVRRDGSIGKGEVFVDLTALIPGDEALDGIKVDKLGHVYLSAPGGVWIFDRRRQAPRHDRRAFARAQLRLGRRRRQDAVSVRTRQPLPHSPARRRSASVNFLFASGDGGARVARFLALPRLSDHPIGRDRGTTVTGVHHES